MNFLEELAAEWFAYTGYFVRTNILTHKRPNGGYDHEIDMLAFSASSKEFVHLEASWDANSWEERKQRFLKQKFVYSQKDYESIVGDHISKIRKIALVGLGHSAKSDLNWGQGIEVLLIPKFIASIVRMLSEKNPLKDVVPEVYPRLRAMQLSIHFGNAA